MGIPPSVFFRATFYAILRAVPSKLGGVIAMGAAIAVLFVFTAELTPFVVTASVAGECRTHIVDLNGLSRLIPKVIISNQL